MYTKRDLSYSIITGVVTGIIGALLLRSLLGSITVANVVIPEEAWYLLIFIIPVLWIMGTYILGYRLSKYVPFLFQFSKFVAVGFMNFSIDFGILNFLVAMTGVTAGLAAGGLKAVAFVAAVTNSYFWNKYWSFKDKTHAGAGQFVEFLGVTLVGLLINVAIIFAGTKYVEPLFGLSPQLWLNFVNVVAVAISLFWNFVGYKLFVFKKKDADIVPPANNMDSQMPA